MPKIADPLTDLQRRALLALTATGQLRRTVGGYEAGGATYFATTTLDALQRRGLARIVRGRAQRDVAYATTKGERWARAEAAHG